MPTKSLLPLKKDGQKELARRDAFSALDDMERQMERLWERVGFGPWPAFAPFRRFWEPPAGWMPRMDVYEKGGWVVVKVELPGLKREDVQVEVDAGDLVIRGERKAEEEVKEADYYRMERRTGSFYRRVALPEGVDPEQIAATFRDGVLEVTMPRPAQATPAARKIPVK